MTPLFEKLAETDIRWILTFGVEREVGKGVCIIREGEQPQDIYIILSGSFEVVGSSLLGKNRLALVGKGEILGEMSFLENRVPTESVLAVEPSTIFAISREKLREEFKRNPVFAGRLYSAMAKIASDRLKRNHARFVNPQPPTTTTKTAVSHSTAESLTAMSALKEEFARLKVTDSMSGNAVLERNFSELCQKIRAELGENSPLDTASRDLLAMRIKQDVTPYLQLSAMMDKIIAKPRGQSVSHSLILHAYNQKPEGVGIIGVALDHCFLLSPTAKAIHSACGLIIAEIQKRIFAVEFPDSFSATALGSGGVATILHAMSELAVHHKTAFTLIDNDTSAKAFLEEQYPALLASKELNIIHENPILIALGLRGLPIQNQELIMAFLLFDTVSDDVVVKLLNVAFRTLLQGGECIFTNFSPVNPLREFFDFALDWKLHYRSAKDLRRLIAASDFASSNVLFLSSESDILLVVKCIK